MRHCAPHEDNLALLAGGDLASAAEEQVLREHLSACEGCQELLEDLRGDLQVLASLPSAAVEEGDSLAADVLKRLAATEAPAARKSAPVHQLQAAATVLVVATAFLGALWLQDSPVPADGGVEVPSLVEGSSEAKSLEDGLPIRVYRAGDSLELEWAGDGREALTAAPATTYRVVASALPNDFEGGRAVEVAGQRLVTSDMPFPKRKLGDRDLTFFRVE
jgi:hypothetical protein